MLHVQVNQPTNKLGQKIRKGTKKYFVPNGFVGFSQVGLALDCDVRRF